MDWILRPWHLTILVLAGWMNREQGKVIRYLETENAVLREKLGKQRILLTDDQRRRLAVKGKELGRKGLSEISTLFTPDTIQRWHRQLVSLKWDYSSRRRGVGRPPVAPETVELIVRIARENPTWGYVRIQGALRNLGLKLSDSTVGNVLKEHGIEPAPKRRTQTTWKTFLKAHWDVLAAADFTTVEVWTSRGLVTFYVLVVMRLSTRQVEIAGITPNPNAAWMQQIARNLTDCDDGFLLRSEYLLLDRDVKYLPLRGVFQSGGPNVVLLPPKSPNLNAHIERFIRSLKCECLDRLILFGEKPLRRALAEFTKHYHTERNHQGVGNEIISPGDEVGRAVGEIQRRERLGGMLNYYYREAA